MGGLIYLYHGPPSLRVREHVERGTVQDIYRRRSKTTHRRVSCKPLEMIAIWSNRAVTPSASELAAKALPDGLLVPMQVATRGIRDKSISNVIS